MQSPWSVPRRSKATRSSARRRVAWRHGDDAVSRNDMVDAASFWVLCGLRRSFGLRRAYVQSPPSIPRRSKATRSSARRRVAWRHGDDAVSRNDMVDAASFWLLRGLRRSFGLRRAYVQSPWSVPRRSKATRSSARRRVAWRHEDDAVSRNDMVDVASFWLLRGLRRSFGLRRAYVQSPRSIPCRSKATRSSARRRVAWRHGDDAVSRNDMVDVASFWLLRGLRRSFGLRRAYVQSPRSIPCRSKATRSSARRRVAWRHEDDAVSLNDMVDAASFWLLRGLRRSFGLRRAYVQSPPSVPRRSKATRSSARRRVAWRHGDDAVSLNDMVDAASFRLLRGLRR